MVDINVATAEYNAKVLTGYSTYLLAGNRDVNRYSTSTLGDKDGFTIKFGTPVLINHISTQLWDKDFR